VESQDSHTRSVVACVAVSNSEAQNDRVLRTAARWVEENRPDLELLDIHIEPR
jgi:uncharacterized protein YlxP (DUF503 family)